MESLDKALNVRMEELTRSSKEKRPFLSTTGTQAAIAELIARSDRLEQAICELALEVETLAAAPKGGVLTPPASVR